MTKNTIMQRFKEAQEKAEAEGKIPSVARLASYMADDDGVCCPGIESYLAVHTLDALERIANALESNANQTQAKSNQTQIKGSLTYHEFFEEFNKKSDYHARKNNRGWVDIVLDGKLIASFLPHTGGWYFTETESSFPADELMLMTKLAATPPELRGEIDDERNS